MALHLVARLVGDERAREVRRVTQHDPAPPVCRALAPSTHPGPGAAVIMGESPFQATQRAHPP